MYVRVYTELDGGALAPATARPVRIHWPDGRSWGIDSIYDRRELYWEHGDFFVAKRSGLAERACL